MSVGFSLSTCRVAIVFAGCVPTPAMQTSAVHNDFKGLTKVSTNFHLPKMLLVGASPDCSHSCAIFKHMSVLIQMFVNQNPRLNHKKGESCFSRASTVEGLYE
jgi:hypothetical protein